MATSSQAVSVTTSATQLNQPDLAGQYDNSHIVVFNNTGESVFIGGSDVSTSNGLEVAASTHSPVLPLYGGDLYGIVATGPQDVRVLQTGV